MTLLNFEMIGFVSDTPIGDWRIIHATIKLQHDLVSLSAHYRCVTTQHFPYKIFSGPCDKDLQVANAFNYHFQSK